jgi:hypothetical protein
MKESQATEEKMKHIVMAGVEVQALQLWPRFTRGKVSAMGMSAMGMSDEVAALLKDILSSLS